MAVVSSGIGVPSAAEAIKEQHDHDYLVDTLTGGLAPGELTAFAGSDRLRPDGRPRAEFRAELRQISNLKNAAVVVWVLALPAVIATLYVLAGRWWLWPVAFVAMGTVFPRLYILNHEAAHRLLFTNRRINDLVGERLLGLVAFGDGSNTYRKVHASHHRDEFGPSEPDFMLYAQYPIETASFRRKVRRDATGVSGWKNLKPILRGLFRPGYRMRAAKATGAQLVIFGLFAVAGHPWLYFTLWFASWMTYWRVVNRLRALAEHAGMTRGDDRRVTTHHIEQNRLTSMLFVPFNTGYHLAHHVDSGVPWRSLPVLHRAMVDDGYTAGISIYPNYRTFWRQLTR